LRLALIAGCLAAAFAVAACGSSNKSSTNSSTTSTGAAASSSAPVAPKGGLPLVLTDFRFQPNAIAGQGGHTVTLQLKNNGTVEHNFSIASQHIDKDLEPGKTATVKVTLPKSGSVQFFCSYHKTSHHMIGSFKLGGASATAPPSMNTTSTSSGGGSGY
jgi:uncharacterized cupredoxin-like copper-binding protein